MAQALSSFSRAEVAPHAQVPAKDAGVPASNGIKIAKFMDRISPTKHVSTIDDQLPSLLAMAIDGLPPLQQSKYADEAEKCLYRKYVERYPKVTSMRSYCRAGVSIASYLHPETISLDRLVAMSFSYTLLFMVDDQFFDTQDKFCQDEFGIDQSACGSLQNIREYLHHLDGVFSQQVQLSNPTPLIETLMWECGRDLLELSNLEWFNQYVAAVVEHHHSGIVSHADFVQGLNPSLNDLESYAIMRAANVGGKFVQTAIEFTNDSYIPSELKATPYFEKLTTTASIHIGFANDICSYHKESFIEQNPRNLISVLMELEGKPFVQTLRMAIDLTNTYARAFMDLEAEAWNSTLRNHFQDVKDLVGGNIYFGVMDDRYRQADSIFPELRDTTSSWKIHPHTKGLEV